MPMTGIEPVSPRPQRGVLTTILLGPIFRGYVDYLAGQPRFLVRESEGTGECCFTRMSTLEHGESLPKKFHWLPPN